MNVLCLRYCLIIRKHLNYHQFSHNGVTEDWQSIHNVSSRYCVFACLYMIGTRCIRVTPTTDLSQGFFVAMFERTV